MSESNGHVETPPKAKLNLAFAFFSYAGNGGASAIDPSIRTWWGDTLKWCKADERIGEITEFDLSDTPITLTRNKAVLTARQAVADVLVMVDNDNRPDLYVGKDSLAKPFIQSSFDFLWSRYQQGKLSCIAAPYCGPPPHECVYVFEYANWESGAPKEPFEPYKLQMISRQHAAIMSGIHPAPAVATGLLMTDMRCFELTEPKVAGDKPWFYYEYRDIYESEKGSTEDVTFSRNLALTAEATLGYNPVHVNWDAWAGHMKPKCVGKPLPLATDNVHQNLRRSILEGRQRGERMTYVHRNEDAERAMEAADGQLESIGSG